MADKHKASLQRKLVLAGGIIGAAVALLTGINALFERKESASSPEWMIGNWWRPRSHSCFWHSGSGIYPSAADQGYWCLTHSGSSAITRSI